MSARDWGPMLAARHLWCELGLEVTLDRLVDCHRRDCPLAEPKEPGFKRGTVFGAAVDLLKAAQGPFTMRENRLDTAHGAAWDANSGHSQFHRSFPWMQRP
jgi:hypothetical protein